jgi:sugar phosphate isomerase/epimerase
MHRRQFIQSTGLALAAMLHKPARASFDEPVKPFGLNYILASSLYGTTPLAEVLAEAAKIGAAAVDIWPRRHADHREQMDALGHDRVTRMLDEAKVRLGIITRFDLGPYDLRNELPVLKKFQGKFLVTGAGKGTGDSVKEQVRSFVASMRPHVMAAAEMGLTIAIENHANSLISTPDSIRYFAEFAPEKHLGLALAPYHLPQDPALIARLVEDLGPKLSLFYAWQHGNGCMAPQPKEQELLQLPGRGPFDFRPVLASLKKINYSGWTEIFMHPYPRGIPIMETTAKVTEVINQSREYLESAIREGL